MAALSNEPHRSPHLEDCPALSGSWAVRLRAPRQDDRDHSRLRAQPPAVPRFRRGPAAPPMSGCKCSTRSWPTCSTGAGRGWPSMPGMSEPSAASLESCQHKCLVGRVGLWWLGSGRGGGQHCRNELVQHLDVLRAPRRGVRRGGISLSTVDSQANFQRWVLVALISLVVAVAAMASEWLPRTKPRSCVAQRLEATDR